MIHRQLPQRLLHTAAVPQAPPAEYDHVVGARVMTCDGHPGVVTAVHDGPFPGTEAYMVELDGGLGGGEYGPGQLTPATYRTAGTAAADYPELTRALVDHPDPARTAAHHGERIPEGHTSWSSHSDPDPYHSVNEYTAGLTRAFASAEMSLGETIVPTQTPGPGPTRPPSPLDNPGSSGWATGSDPNQWSASPLYPLDSRVGSTYDSDVVNDQPIDCPHCYAEPGVLHHHTCPVATDGAPINPLPCAACGQHGHGWHWNDCPTLNGIADSHNHFFPWASDRGHAFQLTDRGVRDENGHVSHDLANCPQCGTQAHVGPQGTTLHGPMAGHPRCTPPPEGVPGRPRSTETETVGEHGYVPDGRDIQHSIGAACPRCNTPMSNDAQRFGCIMCGEHDHHSYCCPSLDAHTAALTESTLHDEPTAALPYTDSELNADDADPESLTPQAFTALLGDFQSKAAHLDPRRSGAGPGDDDIAQAAKAHLASLGLVTATADFSPAERRGLIEEGHGVRAANADRLDLSGTHYAELQALLDGADEEDPSWLVAP